jgi:hypothetical protein
MAISLLSVLKTWRKAGLMAAVAVIGLFIGYGVNAVFFADTAPTQPIAFSHKIHAGDKQIPCLHCHLYAEDSTSAGVPPVSKCMGCHQHIATDRPEIEKLAGYWSRLEPIPWLKVHDLPDFVHFTHKRHVRAGIACQDCHGPVQEMTVVEKVNTLEMGWCLQCHQSKSVRFGRECTTCHK